jgi:hypothetical protein
VGIGRYKVPLVLWITYVTIIAMLLSLTSSYFQLELARQSLRTFVSPPGYLIILLT